MSMPHHEIDLGWLKEDVLALQRHTKELLFSSRPYSPSERVLLRRQRYKVFLEDRTTSPVRDELRFEKVDYPNLRLAKAGRPKRRPMTTTTSVLAVHHDDAALKCWRLKKKSLVRKKKHQEAPPSPQLLQRSFSTRAVLNAEAVRRSSMEFDRVKRVRAQKARMVQREAILTRIKVMAREEKYFHPKELEQERLARCLKWLPVLPLAYFSHRALDRALKVQTQRRIETQRLDAACTIQRAWRLSFVRKLAPKLRAMRKVSDPLARQVRRRRKRRAANRLVKFARDTLSLSSGVQSKHAITTFISRLKKAQSLARSFLLCQRDRHKTLILLCRCYEGRIRQRLADDARAQRRRQRLARSPPARTRKTFASSTPHLPTSASAPTLGGVFTPKQVAAHRRQTKLATKALVRARLLEDLRQRPVQRKELATWFVDDLIREEAAIATDDAPLLVRLPDHQVVSLVDTELPKRRRAHMRRIDQDRDRAANREIDQVEARNLVTGKTDTALPQFLVLDPVVRAKSEVPFIPFAPYTDHTRLSCEPLTRLIEDLVVQDLNDRRQFFHDRLAF